VVINYGVTRAELIHRINATNKTWIKRAKERTVAYARSRKFTGGTEFWGQIKRVYIDLQYEKCAYCETKLPGKVLSSKAHEVEHFRPKGRIRRWPNPNLLYLKGFRSPCPTGNESASGYYLLAYHPFNYAIACTRCNSTLKSDYFPIRGRRLLSGRDPSRMRAEDALLIYPISDIDVDPTDVIVFDGVLAVPRRQSGSDFERAIVTIEFFQLNHEDLTTRRARQLHSLFLILESRRAALNESRQAKQLDDGIAVASRPDAQFSACMTAFVALHKSDRAKATMLANEARKLFP